nr:hypothetical protein Itr_chr01CG07370 [Ipomoea trifida]
MEVDANAEVGDEGQDASAEIYFSSPDSQDLFDEMADRRASYQAHLKSRASATDKGKAPTSTSTAPNPSLIALRPLAPLIIGASPTAAAQMVHAELRGRLKPMMVDSASLKSINAAHAKAIEELDLKITKLETAVET